MVMAPLACGIRPDLRASNLRRMGVGEGAALRTHTVVPLLLNN